MRLLLRDLSPGTNYALQLRSNTGSEVSEWSRIWYITTASDTIAPKKPVNVVGSMVGTSFMLKWDAVTLSTDDTAASDLDHYNVFVQSSQSATTGVYQTTDVQFEFNLEMNRALFGTPKSNVQMAVAAIDKAGNSAGYTTFVSQTNPAPANVTGFVGVDIPDGINFKWNAVSDTDLLEYRIYSGTTVGSQTTLVWSGLATNATIQSIEYAVDKWFKVAAVDVFGTESPSPPVVGPFKPKSPFGVDTTAPGSPTGLTATLDNLSDESQAIATVTWTAVTDTDADLAEYIIGYKPSWATDWQYQKVDYTNTTAKINSLLTDTDYDFRIRTSDWAANLSAWSATVTATKKANTTPSTPAAPTAASNTMQVQVSHNNLKAAGGAMEADVVRYEVYGSTTTGFTPATANMLGTMDVGPAIVGTFPLPASGGGATQTWYIKVIAVDRGGLKSAASAQATATPSLIADANITNATITSAKIASLEANKIVAGTGLINDITVKSKLTLGDASTTGVIESFGYAAGTTGFHFDKNLLEINQGSIAAAALKIQSSPNMVPPEFASFELVPSFYTSSSNFYQGPSWATVSCQTSGGKFGSQYGRMEVTSSTVAGSNVYFAKDQTTYNLFLEPNTQYIYSVWVKTGAVATDIRLRTKSAGGTFTDLASASLPASGAWQRISGVYTSTPNSFAVFMLTIDTLTVGARVDFDGLQVERKIGAETAPSPWSPSGITSADGGLIRTGEIRSTVNTTVNGVAQPNWSINISGNAQFGDALIRGKLLVGQSGADVDAGQSYIASGNYVADTTGWKINSAGDAEFNSGRIRGDAIVDGSLTAQKVAVGVLRTNLIGNPGFEDEYTIGLWDFYGSGGPGNPSQWRYMSGSPVKVTTSRTGNKAMRLNANGAGSPVEASILSPSFQIVNGKTYKIVVYATAVTSPAKLNLQLFTGSTAYNVEVFSSPSITGLGDYTAADVPVIAGSTVMPDDFQPYAGEFTADTTEWAALRVMNYQPTALSGLIVDDISVVEMGIGGASELTSAGLRLFDDTGDEVGAFVSNRPNYFSVSTAGDTIASIDSTGYATFSGLNVTQEPTFYGFPLLGTSANWTAPADSDGFITGWLDNFPRGLVAWGSRGSNSNTLTTGNEGKYLELQASVRPYRNYRIRTNSPNVLTGTAGGRMLLRLRWTTDGSAVGTSSTQLCFGRYTTPLASFAYSSSPLEYIATIGGPLSGQDEVDLRILLTYTPEGASGQIYPNGDPVIISIEDLGPRQIEQGIDHSNVSPPATKKTYVSTWTANNSESYGNFGARPEADLYQGYYSGTQGHQHASILFTGANSTGGQSNVTVATALSGATIKKVEVYLKNTHWYYNSGGTAVIRAQTSTSLITGAPSGTTKNVGFTLGEGKWVDITSIATTSIRGVTLGRAPSTSLSYYGQFRNHSASTGKPLLRITYVK